MPAPRIGLAAALKQEIPLHFRRLTKFGKCLVSYLATTTAA